VLVASLFLILGYDATASSKHRLTGTRDNEFAYNTCNFCFLHLFVNMPNKQRQTQMQIKYDTHILQFMPPAVVIINVFLYSLSHARYQLWGQHSTSNSAVADKSARRTASQLTAKFYNSHVTIIMPFCWWYVIRLHRIDNLILPTRVQNLMTLSSAVPVIWLEPQNFVMGHTTWPHPYQGQFVVRRLWLAHSTFTSNL